MMGGRTPGIRLTVEVLNKRGKLYELVGIIQKLGGDILGVAAVLGSRAETRIFTIKVEGIKLEDLREAVKSAVEQIIDIRETDAK
jgi:uncharacterized protein with ACT and thioredoxin-like domain